MQFDNEHIQKRASISISLKSIESEMSIDKSLKVVAQRSSTL